MGSQFTLSAFSKGRGSIGRVKGIPRSESGEAMQLTLGCLRGDLLHAWKEASYVRERQLLEVFANEVFAMFETSGCSSASELRLPYVQNTA